MDFVLKLTHVLNLISSIVQYRRAQIVQYRRAPLSMVYPTEVSLVLGTV